MPGYGFLNGVFRIRRFPAHRRAFQSTVHLIVSIATFALLPHTPLRELDRSLEPGPLALMARPMP
jgi:hypothetical protein